MATIRSYTVDELSSDDTTMDVSKPSGVVSGDLLLIFISVDKQNVSYNTPTGWTAVELDVTDGGYNSCSLFSKVAGSSEPSAYTLTWDISEHAVASCIAIYDHDGIDSSDSNDGLPSTTAVCPTVTPSTSNTLLLRMVSADGGSSTLSHSTLSGYTQLFEESVGDGTAISVQYTTHTSGATGTANVALNASQGWCALTVAVETGASVDASGTISVVSETPDPLADLQPALTAEALGTLSDFARNALLDHTFNADTYTPGASVYLCLCTADPTSAATGASMNECANSGSYQRTAVTFSAASGGTVTQNADTDFSEATGAWGTVSHWAIADTQTYGSGNVLATGALDQGYVIGDNKQLTIASGAIYVELAGGISDYLANKWLDFMFRNQSFSSPSTYVGLTTATILSSDTGSSVTEVSGGSYARKRVYANGGGSPDWTQAGSNALTNDNDVTFVTPTADWGTVISFFIADAASAGNMLVFDNGIADESVLSGDGYKFLVGQLTVEIR